MSELITNRTHLKKSLAITRKKLRTLLGKNADAVIDRLASGSDMDLDRLTVALRPIVDKNFVMMKNKRVWFDRNNAAIYPKFEEFKFPRFESRRRPKTYNDVEFEGFRFEPITYNECRKSFVNGVNNPYVENGALKYLGNVQHSALVYTRECDSAGRPSHSWISDGHQSFHSEDFTYALLVIHRFDGEDSDGMSYEEAVQCWLDNDLVPEGLTPELEAQYTFLMTVRALAIPLRAELLDCDHVRADLQPYDESRLTDINLGHWELAEPPSEDSLEITLPVDELFVARPPQIDVLDNGTVGIDFGTKSTVVVCRARDERLLRIGQGDYSKAPTLEDYENPTVLELIDLDGFCRAYSERAGRPFTEWQQLKASHQAARALLDNASGSDVYNSVFSELKQWANEPDRRLMLRDRRGRALELKPYAELGDDDFDPIEAYAYYLGLCINNMHNRIYLDYLMSFPVTYSRDVREHIRQSFERGLRKSLPPMLLLDRELMSRFRVYSGASEPAAYAISALKEFGLEPREVDRKVAYAVFDFGGGTTDFDFGYEEVPSDRRSKFVIRRFGAGGDPTLGGENILELMAYEVFKHNVERMRESRITFVLPTNTRRFAGSEALIFDRTGAASQQARMNTTLIAQALRPIWEQHDGYRERFSSGKLELELFASDKAAEEERVKVELEINVERLEALIEQRVRGGVENFFTALVNAFDGIKLSPIHVFLAGNSCQAAVVKRLFDEYAAKVYPNEERLKLYLPLGMEKDSDVEIDRRRTGKTGVAFGLLRTRVGGRDVKLIDADASEDKEIKFPYYLGHIDADGLFRVKIDLDVPYGEWVVYTFADEPEFELYYTKEAKALNGRMTAAEVHRARCLLADSDVSDEEDYRVFVRKAAPDRIEYGVGHIDQFADFKGKIYSCRLR